MRSHQMWRVLCGLLCVPALAFGGQIGLKGHVEMPGYYFVSLAALPDCAACSAFWDLRFHHDEDGLDPDGPGETRWAFTIQIGRQRGQQTPSIVLLDNMTGVWVKQVLTTAFNVEEGVWIDMQNNEPDYYTFWLWWAPPGSLAHDSHAIQIPKVAGTQRKRALVTARLSAPGHFAGTVRVGAEPGQNFRRWTPITQQPGCVRDKTAQQSVLKIDCAPVEHQVRR